MPTWNYKGREIELDEDGFITDWQNWEEGMAEQMAQEDGVTLTEGHWEIIKWLREYFVQYSIAPPIKMLVKEMGKIFGPDKANTKYLYKLFPAGPAKQACRYAGLPKPTGCV